MQTRLAYRRTMKWASAHKEDFARILGMPNTRPFFHIEFAEVAWALVERRLSILLFVLFARQPEYMIIFQAVFQEIVEERKKNQAN